MNTFLIVDLANLLFRSKYVVRGDPSEKAGLALSIVFNSIFKIHKLFNPTHIVFALEGRSWRKDLYQPYKRNRLIDRSTLTPTEIAEDEEFRNAFTDFCNFLKDHTNSTVLQHSNLEADDLVSGFIQAHPLDDHLILSSDSDFHQLIAKNVKQFNGINEELITINGIIDKKGNSVKDKKHPEMINFDPEWIKFKKIFRGDTSDNVFSAYPGIRIKGSSSKPGLLDAFEDRFLKGYNWNNIMKSQWSDHEGITHNVYEDYERNKILIDLTCQPDDIKVKIFETIASSQLPKNNKMIGSYFLKFCGKYQLLKLSEQTTTFSEIFSKAYPKYE